MVSFNGKNGSHKQFKQFAELLPGPKVPLPATTGHASADGVDFFLFTDIHYVGTMRHVNEDELLWEAFQIIAYQEMGDLPIWPGPVIKHAHPVYRSDEDPDGEEGTIKLSEAFAFLEFWAKRKGCCDFLFTGDDENGFTHACSIEQLQSMSVLLERMYEISQRVFQGKPPLS